MKVGFEAQKIYPALEPLTVIPTGKKQVFIPKTYGFEKVEVEGVESEELNIMPSTENQVKEGMFNKVTVAGDENLIAENIKKDVEIFGVVGTSKGLIQGAFEGETNELKNTIENASIEDLSIIGKSEQEKRTGKNLFNGVLESGLLLATNGTTYEKSDSYVCSRNYVDVRGLTEITVSSKNNLVGVYYILQYDKTAAYIGEQHSTYQTSFSAQLKENTAYVRVEMGNSTNKPTVETLGDFQVEPGMTKTKYERYGIGPSVEYPCNLENVTKNIEIQVANRLAETDVNYQKQTVIFPLNNQKLMEGSYLAEDGIHHKRKQVILDGTEGWGKSTTYSSENYIMLYWNNDAKYWADILSNMFKYIRGQFKLEETYITSVSTSINVRIDKNIIGGDTVEHFNSWLSTQYANGTPVIIEYVLKNEEIIPYTEEQQKAYNQLKMLTTYSGITYITTTHELKPILAGKYYMEPVEGNATIDTGLVTENTSNIDKNLLQRMTKKLPNYLDTSNLESLSYLFYYYENVTDFPEIDSSKAKYLNYAFAYCQGLEETPNIDTTNVLNFERCFNQCYGLKRARAYNTAKATNMSYMFYLCSALQEIPELDASNVIYIGDFVTGCSSLTKFGGLRNLGKAYTRTSANYSSYTLNLTNCKNITHQSLMNVINNLYDLNLTYDVANGGTLYSQRLILGDTNIAKLTAEEIAIATSKRVDC